MFKKRSDALAQMSKPWLWCEKCENNCTHTGTISEQKRAEHRVQSDEAPLLDKTGLLASTVEILIEHVEQTALRR